MRSQAGGEGSAAACCEGCGAPLKGRSYRDACAVCGRPVLWSLHAEGGSGGRVRAEQRCFKCGYDLAGLEGPGKCPECGAVLIAPAE